MCLGLRVRTSETCRALVRLELNNRPVFSLLSRPRVLFMGEYR